MKKGFTSLTALMLLTLLLSGVLLVDTFWGVQSLGGTIPVLPPLRVLNNYVVPRDIAWTVGTSTMNFEAGTGTINYLTVTTCVGCGGGGGGTGQWSTTTWGGIFFLNDVFIGANSTTSAFFWFNTTTESLIVTGNITGATGTFDELVLGDDERLYFDDAKTRYIEYNTTNQGALTFGTASGENYFAFDDSEWTFYVDIDGSWLPYFALGEGGSTNIALVSATGTIFKASSGAKGAILGTANIATTDKLFQFPNYSGTLIGTGNLTDITTVGTIGTGVWNGTPIDFSSYTNATATEGILFSGDAIGFDCSAVTDSAGDHLTCSGEDLVVSDDWWNALADMTLTTGYFYVGNGSNDPVATNTIFINTDGSIKFNNKYSFPTATGTTGYILELQADGTLAWGADDSGAGGGTDSDWAVSGNGLIATDTIDYIGIGTAGQDIGTSTAYWDDAYIDTLILNDALDISSYTNLTAGRGLTLTDDDIALDADIYSKDISISIYNASDTMDAIAQKSFSYPITITKIECSTNASASSTIQFDERNYATPNTAGVDVLSAALVCDSDSASSSAFANAGIAAEAPLSLDIDTVTGTVSALRIHIFYTVDD